MKRADGSRLGWWLAGVLALVLSVAEAGALDLDREIARHNETSTQISASLGRDRGSIKMAQKQELPSLDESDLVDDYKVELIPVKR